LAGLRGCAGSIDERVGDSIRLRYLFSMKPDDDAPVAPVVAKVTFFPVKSAC
jgi:hypothetical protein